MLSLFRFTQRQRLGMPKPYRRFTLVKAMQNHFIMFYRWERIIEMMQ